MNWLYVFVLVFIVGFTTYHLGLRFLGQGKEHTPSLTMHIGHLVSIAGIFGSIAQFIGFPATMLLFTVVCGLVFVLDKTFFEKRRGNSQTQSMTIEYAKGFFPILIAIFVMRSFLAEPFRIPSSSMRPGFIVGDIVLVNKFEYGLRVPLLNTVFLPISKPQRWDVMVFNAPEENTINLVKRVIGLPGDTITYINKRLHINGKAVNVEFNGNYQYTDKGFDPTNTVKYKEYTSQKSHHIIVDDNQSHSVILSGVRVFQFNENCHYTTDGFVCKVPEGHYFVMGDNRDYSQDSRYWGFVPDSNIVGKVVMVLMNFGDKSRLGVAP